MFLGINCQIAIEIVVHTETYEAEIYTKVAYNTLKPITFYMFEEDISSRHRITLPLSLAETIKPLCV